MNRGQDKHTHAIIDIYLIVIYINILRTRQQNFKLRS